VIISVHHKKIFCCETETEALELDDCLMLPKGYYKKLFLQLRSFCNFAIKEVNTSRNIHIPHSLW
jgi:hypothetical protein